MTFLENLLTFLGRVCISVSFFWYAAEIMMNWDAAMARLKEKRVPQAQFVLPISVAVKILGAIMILLGFYPRVGALLLILVIAPATIRFHNFWDLQGTERAQEKSRFRKDVAVIGGLLFLLAMGGGHFGFTG